MERKDFINTGLAVAGAALFPQALLSKSAIKSNQEKFPQAMTPAAVGSFKEFELYVDFHQQQIVPGFSIHTLAFNNQVPGPEIRVNRGDKVRVIFRNKTELNHTIHWHGIHVPWRMDGVPYVTQMPVMPGQKFVYEFVAEPYGTHFYHCHWGTLLHMQSGMYGSFIVEDPDDPIKKRFPYERDYTLVYSAHDSNFIRDELNVMLERMKERMYLMKTGRFDAQRFGLFDSKKELEKAIDGGYQPPYLLNRRSSAELPVPNWFTVNGKSYPSTPNLYINEGEFIRVRLINAGGDEHYLHMHGHDFWHVCDDGIPLAQPSQMNTIRLSPGKTADIIVEGTNRGIWTFHDHDVRRVTNNGLYPGGNLMALVYEDLPMSERMVGPMAGMKMDMASGKMDMLPKVALDE
ncbi:MAG: multicopper oxidase domain-containing protein [Candidatus Marinimicrobia bacterium]|nr:multicopper oxidase domain-containing protein [Candidatus Neomarinimicrobiota bacterium]